MTLVFIRILLRYLAAVLVTRGLIAPDLGEMISRDPDIAMALQVTSGALIAALAEGWYYLAHKFGWRNEVAGRPAARRHHREIHRPAARCLSGETLG
jgi:hypothetical protein